MANLFCKAVKKLYEKKKNFESKPCSLMMMDYTALKARNKLHACTMYDNGCGYKPASDKQWYLEARAVGVSSHNAEPVASSVPSPHSKCDDGRLVLCHKVLQQQNQQGVKPYEYII